VISLLSSSTIKRRLWCTWHHVYNLKLITQTKVKTMTQTNWILCKIASRPTCGKLHIQSIKHQCKAHVQRVSSFLTAHQQIRTITIYLSIAQFTQGHRNRYSKFLCKHKLNKSIGKIANNSTEIWLGTSKQLLTPPQNWYRFDTACRWFCISFRW